MIKFYETKSNKPSSAIPKKGTRKNGKPEAENKKEEDDLIDTNKIQLN